MADNAEDQTRAASMASSMAVIRERAAQDPDARHQAFDSFPWQTDSVFASQLVTALEDPTHAHLSRAEVAVAERARRFSHVTGIAVDPSEYHQWLSRCGRQQPRVVSEQAVAAEVMNQPDPNNRTLAKLLVELRDPLGALALQHASDGSQTGSTTNTTTDPSPSSADVLPQPSQQQVEEGIGQQPSWQAAAPKAQLYVPKSAATASGSSSSSKEPYPKKFEEILAFLQTGKEIPGIREIPDTVVGDEEAVISHHGRMQAPPKPWERHAATGSQGPAAVAQGSSS